MAGVRRAGAWLLLVAMVAALSCVAVGAERMSHHDSVVEIRFGVNFERESASKVFGPAPTSNSASNFGKGKVKDYPVVSRESKQDRDSRRSHNQREIGRARGLYFYDSLNGAGVQELFTVTFTRGEYRDSSLTFCGHWEQDSRTNEIAVTGGTGMFKFAVGSAEFRQLNSDRDSDNSDREPAYEVRALLKGVMEAEPESRRGFF